MSGGKGKVVCVTGGSGYVASWLVKLLLHRGYTVKATVRNPNDPKKTEHLLSLDGAKERLHLFKAELVEEGSFDSIIDGCDGVFHTASPVHFSASDPQLELIDPALKGTLNVLNSCKKSPSVKRVVFTSSIATVAYNGKPLTPDVLWYMVSKTLAEEAAWKFAKENGIDLITINPGLVIGPLLQPVVNFSVEVFLHLMKGDEAMPSAIYRWVDVRDVANAHIQAFEIPSANGRYCMVGRVAHSSEALKILHELFPALPLPKKNGDEQTPVKAYTVSKERAKSLGIVNFIPLEVSLKDTIESLKEKNIISF